MTFEFIKFVNELGARAAAANTYRIYNYTLYTKTGDSTLSFS